MHRTFFGPTGAFDTTGAQAVWDFGDGTSGTDLVANHTYAHAGIYNASAVVTLAGGQTVTVGKTIEVQTPLALRADFNSGAGDQSDIANAVTVGSKVTNEAVGSDTAIRLNGDHIAYHVNAELLNNPEFTVVAEFKKDAGHESDGGKILYFSGSVVVVVQANALSVALTTDHGTNWIKASNVGIQDSAWHQVALTFSGNDGAAILYVDGAEVAHLDGLDGAIQTGSPYQDFNVGDPFGGGFNGLIDNVEFWKGAMSPAQLQSLTPPGKQGLNWDDQAIKFVGSMGDDSLTGGTHNDTLQGFSGNDHLIGSGGEDIIQSGSGKDTLAGGSGGDTLNGGGWNDTLYGGGGDDSLVGAWGNDNLVGGGGDDTLRGGAGNDALNGGVGRDVMIGGDGNDAMAGGSYADTFVFERWLRSRHNYRFCRFELGKDRPVGRDGHYRFYRSCRWPSPNDPGTGYALIVDGTNSILLDGVTVADIGVGHSYSDQDFIFASGSAVIGSSWIAGAINDNKAPVPTAGDDDLKSTSHADSIDGKGGNDTIHGAGGDDTLFGDAGRDQLIGGAGADVLNGGGGGDALNGNGGGDVLRGAAGNDRLNGGGGHDTIDGGKGDDSLAGGAMTDTFAFSDGFGHDTISGFSANNHEDIDLSGVSGITGFHNLITHHLTTDDGSGFALITDGTSNTILLMDYTVHDFGAGQPISGADFIFA